MKISTKYIFLSGKKLMALARLTNDRNILIHDHFMTFIPLLYSEHARPTGLQLSGTNNKALKTSKIAHILSSRLEIRRLYYA